MRANKRPTLLLTTALVVVTTAWAAAPVDEVTLTGHVFDDSTGLGIPAAQVFIADMNVGVLTQQGGDYTLRVPRERIHGDLTLTVQRIGYAQADIRIHSDELSADTLTRDVRLHQEALQLNELVVTGTPSPTQRRALGNSVRAPTADKGAPVERPSAPAKHEAPRPPAPALDTSHRRPRVSGGGQPGWNR